MFKTDESDFENAMKLFSFLCGDSPEMGYIVIEGEPYSKARPRFSKTGKVYNTQKQKKSENDLKRRMENQVSEPVGHNLAMGCIFYRSSKQRIDVDNMLKNVMDAANGIIYIDDCQVTAKLGIVELDKERPRTVIVYGRHETSMVRELKTTITCENCKKEYKPNNGFGSKEKYCSRECYKESTTKEKERTDCLACGNEFEKKTKTQKFCSENCRRNDVRKRNKRLKIHEKAFCDVCGKELSKPTYKRCRDCWLRKGSGG